MVAVIDGFRWAILGGDAQVIGTGFALSSCLIMLIFVTGVRYFRAMEKTFADVI